MAITKLKSKLQCKHVSSTADLTQPLTVNPILEEAVIVNAQLLLSRKLLEIETSGTAHPSTCHERRVGDGGAGAFLAGGHVRGFH